ncbi:EamA family transporter [Chloroflexota bacterium]
MTLDWVTTALLSSAILGMVHIVDSYLISKRMPSFKAYLLVIGIFIFVTSLALSLYFPLPTNIGAQPVFIAVLSGIARAISVIIMLYLMKREEVSVIIPISNSYPIIVALIAIPTLNETISYVQWVAIVIVVIGVLLASVKLRGKGAHITWLGKPLVLLTGSSILWAVSDVTAKYTLEYMSFWNMYWIPHLILASAFLVISFRSSVFREIINVKKRNSLFTIVLFNETIAVISIVLFYWSMQRGPVSLVSAIYSSRLLFVFLYAVIISRFSNLLLESQSDKGALILRFVSVILIVSGIVLIYITK